MLHGFEWMLWSFFPLRFPSPPFDLHYFWLPFSSSASWSFKMSESYITDRDWLLFIILFTFWCPLFLPSNWSFQKLLLFFYLRNSPRTSCSTNLLKMNSLCFNIFCQFSYTVKNVCLTFHSYSFHFSDGKVVYFSHEAI